MGEAVDEIAVECIAAIAEFKGIPRESITLDQPLESLDLDSLDRVSMSFDLEEKYGVEIPEHKLHGIVTVADLAREIRFAVNEKNAGAARILPQ